MKISLKWLQDFVDVAEFMQKPEALAKVLTAAGLEVEEINQKAKDFQFVYTGLILEKDKHPNADKLSLCKVMTQEGVVHQIVCGAQNHKQNDKVVVALPGAILPGNFVIQKAVVRGVESGGMLCSLKELGLAEKSDGIHILPEQAPIGKSFAEYMGYDDVTFELKVTPNRADCLSHYGLAREVSCLLSRPLKKLNQQISFSEMSTKSKMKLSVKSEACGRYAGRFISGVKVGPSPDWLKQRLESVGLNSINNVVDVTNYVMMELGQPLHAFDAALIAGSHISVAMAQKGEKFISLDGTEYTLKGEELLIRDEQQAIALAGVVGGKNSGVQESTKDLFIEAAYFQPMMVRKAARSHGINTDSSYRFSRGVDPENTFLAMDRAVELILQVAGGAAYSEAHDHYPHPLQKTAVEISVKTISDRLGYQAEESKFLDFMVRLGCQVENSSGSLKVRPPSYRFDLESEMDLVEEYARLNGYEHIPETLPPFLGVPSQHDFHFVQANKISQSLRASGFSQSLNMSFASRNEQKKFLGNLQALKACGLETTEEAVAIINPLSEESNVLRSSLSYGLFKNVLHNFHQGVEWGRLFEHGKVFNLKSSGEYGESPRIGLVAWGQSQHLWSQGQQSPLIFEVKAAIENLLLQLNIKSSKWVTVNNKGEIPDFLHRGQNAILFVEGKNIGFIGTVHPEQLDEHKIRVPVVMAELNTELLLRDQPRSSKFVRFSRFPKVERDLALVMAKALRVSDVQNEIKKAGGAQLLSIQVFDVYEGDKLPMGQKSVAFRLAYQDANATLHDQVVNESIQKVLENLKQKFSITVR
jgi:phenylalanyl-tRNA synthetase beta chain